MTQPSTKSINLAKALREDLAGDNLPRSFAKLYSQYTKLRAGQEGISGWHTKEAVDRLQDAMRLLECAFACCGCVSTSWLSSTFKRLIK
jgi:hypothetical protein